MSEPTPSPVKAYPLQWPEGWPRTEAHARESGRFQSELASALKMLRHEVEMMGGKNLVLSSNCALGEERPKDVGVCAYFTLRDQHLAIPCDRWNKVSSNVKAIALTIEAMRGMERWGAKHMITAMFKGFKALPPRSGESCWDVLGIHDAATEKEIMDAYYAKANRTHPDKGGTAEAFRAVTQAKDLALSSLKHRAA